MLTLTNKKQLGVLSSSFKANGCFLFTDGNRRLWTRDVVRFGVCRVNHKSLLLKAPQGGGGDTAYERGGDARRKFWIKPLKETDLGGAQAIFDP